MLKTNLSDNSNIKYLAKSILHGANNFLSDGNNAERGENPSVTILTYHSISRSWPKGSLQSLPARQFYKQMKFCSENYSIIPLDRARKNLANGSPLSNPGLVVTFDDGFLDNETNAIPILKYFNIPATLFVSTGFIDTGFPPWTTQISEILERTNRTEFDVGFSHPIRNIADKLSISKRLKNLWKGFNPSEMQDSLELLKSRMAVSYRKTVYPSLSWDGLRHAQKSGITVGSHSVYHSILPFVDDLTARKEIAESKLRIEDRLQSECCFFAYPDGKYDARSIEYLINANYKCSVSQDYGINHQLIPCHELKRINVPYHDPMSTFKRRLYNA